MKYVFVTVCLFFALLYINVFAAENSYERKVYYASRLDTVKPVIDGRLDDACWQEGNWETGFVQWRPHEGGKASQKTEFAIIYDNENVYCAYRAFDREPEKISRLLARRDGFAGDVGGFAFDSYHDRRTAFEFSVSAAGTKIDLTHLDTGTSWEWDTTWDAVWKGKAASEDSAWTVEIEVPLTQLRFNDKEEHVWGLHVWRYLYRINEEVLWQPVPRYGQGGVHYFADMHGIRGIKSQRLIELIPYVRGKGELFQKESGNPFAKGRRSNTAAGLDGKIGLGSNFVLDLTVNPDFGQVEADPSVINLTAFETFFEEKRPFFMEGKQSVMNFQIGDDMLYYSRRIGKNPSHIPDLAVREHLKMPEKNTILNAFKVTGKTDDGLAAGLMQSVTLREEAEIHSESGNRKETVEPLTSFLVGRLQKEYRRGGTVLGGIFTSTNRKISQEEVRSLHDNAYSGGMDFRHMWGNMTYYMNMNTVFSSLQGSRQAIALTRQSSRHYYQRPDAGYLERDSLATSLSGHGGTFEVGKGGTGRWRFSENLTWFSPGLDFNDIGYLKTADIITQNSKIGYVVNRPFWLIRDFTTYADQYNHWNFGRERLVSGISAETRVQFINEYGINATLSRETEQLDTRLLRGGPAFILPSIWSAVYSIHTKRQTDLSFFLNCRNIWFDEPYSKYYRITPGFRLHINEAFNIQNTFAYTFNRDDRQYLDTYYNGTDKQYLLGRINQKTLSTTFRLNYCVTPDLTIQYYGQPFISAGTYSHFKRVSNPRASAYRDRYKNYIGAEIQYDSNNDTYLIDEDRDSTTDFEMRNPDFKALQFRSNFVLRWEYNPGSTFYLVWSQNRSSSGIDEIFRFRRDLRNLFDTYPHDIFMVKWSHWFSI